MRFDYYASLSARDKAVYDRSDRLPDISLPASAELSSAVTAVREALAEEKLSTVQRAMTRLSHLVCQALKAAPLEVKVKAKRPIRSDGEYYGLYEHKRGSAATLTLWMRTARQKRVVTFKTFLRTFAHELCHHLDFDLYRLKDSFHTQGFFRRESSLYRSLLPADQPARHGPKQAKAARPKEPAQPTPKPKPHAVPRTRTRPAPKQTELPFTDRRG